MINTIKKMSLLFMAFMLSQQALGATAGFEGEEKDNYRACLNMAASNPKSAFDEAIKWEGLGGGHPARYCALAALMGLGHYGEAAQGFEALADAVHAGPKFKARLLSRSSEAWLLLNQLDMAMDVADTAVRMAPTESEPLIIRARIMAARGAYWEATDDLGRAIAINPNNADALAFRASAWRQLEVLELAQEDATRALKINPKHPSALLELGNIMRILGDNAGARKNWLTVIMAWPNSKAANAARTNIEMMDVSR